MPIQTIVVEAASPAQKTEEVRTSSSNLPELFGMNANSLSSQTILGSLSGLLTGYLDNAYGRMSAIGVGATMAFVRIAEHVVERFPVKDERVLKVKEKSVGFFKRMVDELLLFIRNNMFLAVSYIGGLYGGHQLTPEA